MTGAADEGWRVRPDARSVLSRLPFLQALDADRLAEVARRCRGRRFPVGALLFREGEPCEGAWVVAEGAVTVFKLSVGGRRQTLRTVASGGALALVSALDGGGYPANAEAREPSRLLVVPRDVLLDTMRRAPEVGVAVASLFARRLRRLTSQAASLSLRDVKGRVAAFLLERAEAAGRVQADGSVVVPFPERHADLAERLGTVREVIVRALRDLRACGLVGPTAGGDVLRVVDLPGLRREARL